MEQGQLFVILLASNHKEAIVIIVENFSHNSVFYLSDFVNQALCYFVAVLMFNKHHVIFFTVSENDFVKIPGKLYEYVVFCFAIFYNFGIEDKSLVLLVNIVISEDIYLLFV
jgi:hypothetical protein